jgi:hypothetical protein
LWGKYRVFHVQYVGRFLRLDAGLFTSHEGLSSRGLVTYSIRYLHCELFSNNVRSSVRIWRCTSKSLFRNNNMWLQVYEIRKCCRILTNGIFNSYWNIFTKTISDMTYISNIWKGESCHTSLDVGTLFYDVNTGYSATIPLILPYVMDHIRMRDAISICWKNWIFYTQVYIVDTFVLECCLRDKHVIGRMPTWRARTYQVSFYRVTSSDQKIYE